MPKNQSPAGKGGARHRSKSFGGLKRQKEYDGSDSVSRVAVYSGRHLLGTVQTSAGVHQAFDAAGTQLGVFANLDDAARALRGAR